MIGLNQIKLKRLLIAFFFTFVLADLYPHPNLAPGLIASTFGKVQQGFVVGATVLKSE